MSIEDELKILTTELNVLKTRLTAYEKSGLWTRRDVLKNITLGGLGLVGVSQLVKGDTLISDTSINVAGTDLETVSGSQAKVNTHAAVASPHSGHLVSNNNSYAGDNTANRATAHGLGRTPIAVLFASKGNLGGILLNDTIYPHAAVGNWTTVTGWDATNFYVGNAGTYPDSMNGTGITYRWLAIG